jgi:hypothetical protein
MHQSAIASTLASALGLAMISTAISAAEINFEDNVRFYRVVKGQREQLEGANIKVTANEWHQLGLRAEGERFTITFDGKQLFAATDRTFTGAGKSRSGPRPTA